MQPHSIHKQPYFLVHLCLRAAVPGILVEVPNHDDWSPLQRPDILHPQLRHILLDPLPMRTWQLMTTTCLCFVATSYTALLPFAPTFLSCTTLRLLHTNNRTPCADSRWYSGPSQLYICAHTTLSFPCSRIS